MFSCVLLVFPILNIVSCDFIDSVSLLFLIRVFVPLLFALPTLFEHTCVIYLLLLIHLSVLNYFLGLESHIWVFFLLHLTLSHAF